MTIVRSLACLAAATAVVALAPAAAQAAAAEAPVPWGPYAAPGNAAKALGSLTATGEDHADLPTADLVRISGKVYDNTRRTGTCGWAVFRVTYRVANNLPHRNHWVVNCDHTKSKKFSRSYRDVYQVELKVCAAPKTKKPSLECLYAGTWKTLYLSK